MHVTHPVQSSPSDPKREAAIRGTARGLRIAIAVSTYHDAITSAMLDGAQHVFESAGGDSGGSGGLEIVRVPGAFELLAAASAFARREEFDAVVVLGCIITGETTHDQYIAQAVATGVANIIAQTGVPIAFGVLTCQSIEQAQERAGGSKGNKGEEAMFAAIEAARAVKSIQRGSGVAL